MDTQDVNSNASTRSDMLDKMLLRTLLEKGVKLLVIEVKKQHPVIFGRIAPDPNKARLCLLYIVKEACHYLIQEAEAEIEAEGS